MILLAAGPDLCGIVFNKDRKGPAFKEIGKTRLKPAVKAVQDKAGAPLPAGLQHT